MRVFNLVRRFPLRPLGVLVLLLALWATLGAGLGEADYVLYLAGLATLALLALVGFCCLVGWRWWRQTIGGLDASSELVTMSAQATSARAPWLRWLPMVELGVDWLTPHGVEATMDRQGPELREMVTPRRRGAFDAINRRFHVQDVFGLFQISWHRVSEAHVRILPAIATADSQLAVRAVRGDMDADARGEPEGDLVEMRGYAYGDSMRRVLWKTYARSRRLLVRLPERATSPLPVRLAVLLTGEADEWSASAARAFVEGGALGQTFTFLADGAGEPATTVAAAVEQIVASGTAGDVGGMALATQAVRDATSVVIFVPARDGAWRKRMEDFALTHRATVVVAGPQGQVPSRFVNWALRRPADATLAASAEQIGTRLRALGLDVHALQVAPS